MYNKDEILKVAQMFNRVMEAMNNCKEVNTAANYDGDYLFVECVNGTQTSWGTLCRTIWTESYTPAKAWRKPQQSTRNFA